MRPLTLSLLFYLAISATPGFAETTEYDIEILIFEDASHRYINSEQWPRIIRALTVEKNSGLSEINSNPDEAIDPNLNAVINITNNENGILDNYAKKIDSSSRYNILLRKSWRQTGLDAKSAINIPINSLNNNPGNSVTDFSGEVSTGSNNKLPTSSISGNIKVTLGRYLHIYTDLIYKMPNETNSPLLASSNSDQYKYFAIKSHRRMRSKELHYLDHPLVGILVKALPVKKPPKENSVNKENTAPIKQ